MKEKSLPWGKALKLEMEVKEIGCDYPLVSAIKVTSQKEPDSDQPSLVMCAIKVARNQKSDFCAAVDGSYCPLNINVYMLQDLKKSVGK